MEEGDSEIVKVPIKIFKKIAEYLDRKSTLNCRLTCSTLKAYIDNHVGVTIDLTEDSNDVYTKKQLKFISGIALKWVNAKNILGNDEDKSKGVRSYLKRKHYFDDIFRFPLSLITINFEGKIHVHLLHEILQKCHNLENLYFHKEFDLEGDLIPLLIKEDKKKDFAIKLHERSTWLSILSQRDDLFRQINVKMLKRIYLIFTEKPIRKIDVFNVVLLLKNIRSDVLDQIFLNLCKLKDLSEMEYFNLSMIFTEFIQAHSKTLRRILFCLGPKVCHDFSHSSVEDCLSDALSASAELQLQDETIEAEVGNTVNEKIQILSTLRKRVESIGKLPKLTYLVMEAPPFFHWDFWLLFIGKQELTYLLLGVSTRYRILKNCQFLKNSSKSLQRLRMNLDILHEFDFSGLEECTQLEEVYVFNRPTCSDIIKNGSFEAQVKNVKFLPPGLKGLCLGNVVVDSEDLNKMLSNQKMLDTLVVMNMHSMNPDNGTDCKFLKKVVRLRSLHSCLIQGMRSKTRKTYDRIFQMLDFQMEAEERDYLKKIDHIMGYGQLFNAKLMAATYYLDILSPEVYQRYIWVKHKIGKTNYSNYSIKFNDSDPYLL